MKVYNLRNDKGRAIPNQLVIEGNNGERYFQSYDSIIAKIERVPHKCNTHQIVPTMGHCDNCGGYREKVSLDKYYWDYSKTTARHRNSFLGLTTKKTQAKIDSGEIVLVELNNGGEL